MLGHLSGQYRATLAPILFNPAGCSKLWASFWVEHIFVGCGRPVIFFYIYNAKPFIALGDVKSTECLQQCHATEGRPTWPIWDTVEPGPHLSLCPLPLHIFCTHPPPGRAVACWAFDFFLRGGSEVSITTRFSFHPEKAIVWCCAFNHP